MKTSHSGSFSITKLIPKIILKQLFNKIETDRWQEFIRQVSLYSAEKNQTKKGELYFKSDAFPLC